MIGQSFKRKEDVRLLTGSGRFVDDLRLPGVRRLVVVRSPYARAKITRIDASGALAMPGVSVFTAADLPEVRSHLLPTFVEPASNPYAVSNTPPPQHVLALEEVRHVGEPVVAVVADDPYRAVDAAEAIRVEYEPLPPIVDPEAAAQDGAPQVHAGRSNVVGRIQMSVGDVDRAFAEADVVVEERIRYPRVTSMPLEPRAAAAQFDEASGTLTVWSGHQGPYMLRDAVAAFLGVPAESVRVIVPDTGGAFGPKIAVYPEDVLVAVLAARLRTPIKWIQTRSEFMTSTQHARDQVHYVKLAARRDGTLLGLQIRIIKDIGAYHCWAMIEPTNCINHLPSHYRLRHVRGEAISVVTNKVPSSPYRGAGRPEAVFVTERLLDVLAARLGMDPAELRRRNLISPEEMPYRSGLTYRDGVPIVYDGGDYPLELRRALELADYDGWRRRQAEWRAQGRYVGIGIAAYLEAGGIGWPCEGATVKVDDRGNVEVMIGVSHSGQGH